MTRGKWFLVGLLGFCIPALMAPSGGFPYFPIFGKVTVNAGPLTPCGPTNATSCFRGPATGFSTVVTNANSGATSRGLGVFVTGTTADLVFDVASNNGANTLFAITAGGAITAPNATSVPWSSVIDSGATTLTLATGCTTTPTVNALLHRIGNMVIGELTQIISCAANNPSVTLTGLPAAFRPASVTGSAQIEVSDNSVTKPAVMSFCDATGGTCTAGTILIRLANSTVSATGTLSTAFPITFAYTLD